MSSQHRAEQHAPSTTPTVPDAPTASGVAVADPSHPLSTAVPDASTAPATAVAGPSSAVATLVADASTADAPSSAGGPGATPVASEPTGRACGCVSRRQTFVVAGAAVVGTAGLAACGAAEDAVDTAASSAASAASSAASDLIKAADIPVGGGKVFENLKVVVTQPTEGDFKAFSATCPHQGCSVGSVANNVITCPCHGSTFDAATGEVTQGPATKGLDTKSVTVGADGITVT